ncbi:pyochelin biosynthetic protein PchC [Kibdelosporangium banguiense]|uniref:Pyochelin biosynthetic protein PchC n=1 Tax=Kibdelosporangium banguiense TaxID=1365924 RepID=A0ABS4THC7_9PSEU|nr:alpha/beta fold hydrolase [Kibdelosporangium banguiense]MBP2323835.1 pyochelin biosynthetic protein PchC [Kibdelosporangium banguiense]
MNKTWFRQYRPSAAPDVRLICLPHAGGAPSSYREWPVLLPGNVDVLAVCYPGRQDRFAEQCFTDMHALADALTEVVLPLTDTPFALFGHSMGAALAHEVTIRLAKTGRRPQVLMVSGRAAPHLAKPEENHLGGDEAILADVRRLGGETSSDALDDPDLRELLMPALRADYHIVGTYQPSKAGPVATPIVAYTGDKDPDTPVADVEGWAEITTAGFRCKVFPGDHFFLEPNQRDLVADVANVLVGGPAR